MKTRLTILLVLLVSILALSQPANAQGGMCFTPYYSSYTSYTIDGNFNATQTVYVSGYTGVNYQYQICAYMMSTAQHSAQITNTIGSNGGVWQSGPTCPTCQMNVSYTVTANLDTDGYETGETASSILCSAFGLFVNLPDIHLEIEAAKTEEWSTGVLSNCHWLEGPLSIEDCDIGSVPYCSAATSPPDMHLSPTEWQVYPVPAPNYWDTIAICARFGGKGTPWGCSKGLATPIVGTPSSLYNCTNKDAGYRGW